MTGKGLKWEEVAEQWCGEPNTNYNRQTWRAKVPGGYLVTVLTDGKCERPARFVRHSAMNGVLSKDVAAAVAILRRPKVDDDNDAFLSLCRELRSAAIKSGLIARLEYSNSNSHPIVTVEVRGNRHQVWHFSRGAGGVYVKLLSDGIRPVPVEIYYDDKTGRFVDKTGRPALLLAAEKLISILPAN